MKKSIIISGEETELDKVIRENRIRVDRGIISFKEVGKKRAVDTKDLGGTDNKQLASIDGKSENTPIV